MKIILFLITFIGAIDVSAQRIRVKGNWSLNYRKVNLRAGEDLPGKVQSESDQVDVSVNGNVNRSLWTIRVSLLDNNQWNNHLEVWVRRTSNGVGSGNVWGGTTFQRITPIETDFIHGARVVNKIQLQYEIRGLSVVIPSGDYVTRVVYTLYEQ